MDRTLIDSLSLMERMEGGIKTATEANSYAAEVAKRRIEELKLPQYDDTFDMRTIPEDILDEGYIPYETFLLAVSHNSALYRRRYVAEGIDYRGNVQRAKEEIERWLPIKTEYQFREKEAENGIWIALLVSRVPGNHEVIIEVMTRLGFYKCNRKNNIGILYDNKCREWEHMVFKPCEQDDVTEQVKEQYHFVYHATPSMFTDTILHNGIEPSNKNPEVDYNGPALFVMKGSVADKEEEIQRIVNDLFYQAKQKGYENLSPDYTILGIVLSELNTEVRFFLDSDEKMGLFTRTKIPPQALFVYKEKVTATDNGIAPQTLNPISGKINSPSSEAHQEDTSQ